MATKFHLKKTKDDQFHFNLHVANDEVIFTSKLYKTEDSALSGIESVRKNPQRDGALGIEPANNGKFHLVLKATNGQVVGQSQLYTSQASAEASVQSVKRTAPETGFSDESWSSPGRRRCRWRLRASRQPFDGERLAPDT